MENTIETLMPLTDVSSYIRSLFADARRLTGCGLFSDESYVHSRILKEGDRFVFTVLPLLGKAVEKSLIRMEPLVVPAGFALYGKTRLSRFLFPLMQKCFSEGGEPVAEPDYVSLLVIRQLTLFFSKVTTASSCDATEPVKNFLNRVQHCGIRGFNRELLNARRFCHLVLENCKELEDWDKSPKGHHGPGAVAGGECGVEKWQLTHYPQHHRQLFDFNQNCQYDGPEGCDNALSKILAVPKDYRGPRIICAEPKEFQFGQQGLKEVLYELLQRHYLTRNSINFECVKGNMAACSDKELVTIDLKDASDNLSIELARFLLPRKVFQLLTRYRTPGLTHDGKNYSYRAFATMGSALCFPIQTLVFLSIVKGVQWAYNRERALDQWDRRRVLVYGDDIICSATLASRVVETLELAGLTVNTDKTTVPQSPIRESCGEWMVNGASQIIVKPKVISGTGLSQLLSIAETSQLLHEKGWFATAVGMADLYRARYGNPRIRYNKKLQRLESL